MIKAINRSIAATHEEDEKGFTLIELLVVILIIGVLAAIAIPAFLNQREGAWESQVKSDIANATIAAETYGTANNGSFTGLSHTAADPFVPTPTDKDTLNGNGFNPTPDVTITFTPSGTTYTIVGSHDSLTGKTWTYSSATGKTVAGTTP